MKSLDASHIYHILRETPDKIIVFGRKGKESILISEIQQVGANVLIGLRVYDIINKYKISTKIPLPTSRKDPWAGPDRIDLANYEKEYPKSLFNKRARAKNEDHIGHVMKEQMTRSCFWRF